MQRLPSGGQHPLPRLVNPTTGFSSLSHLPQPRPPPAAHFGLVGGYPTPTTGQISYPFMSSKPMDHHYRQSESGDSMRRDTDHNKKRPSLLSDFHLTHTNPVVLPVPSIGLDKSSSLTNVKETMSKNELAARRSLQLDVPTYVVVAENISPTPDDQTDYSGTDKDGILDTIKKVDREINVVEEKVRKLLKKKLELEEATLHSADVVEPVQKPVSSTSVPVEAKNETLFEKIYAENRKKAASAHTKLAHLDPPSGITPVYQQPWDTKLFDDLRKKHDEFRPRLILYLKRMHRAQQIREKYLTEKYNQQMQEWKKKMERFERHPKRIAKEQRNREIFEKTFPELKKQREERERSMRQVDGRSSILGQGDQSYDTVCVQEEEEILKMRQNAVLPPMMYDQRTQRRMRYVNNNNLVRDPIGEHQFRLDFFKMYWTDEEKRTYRDKFLQYGKNFAAIATFLDRKTTKDCVQYYYLTKKRENYKQMMRRPYRRRGKPYKPPLMPRVEDGCKEFGDGIDPDASLSAVSEDVTPGETEYFCIDCKSKIDVNNPGRVLTRLCYEQYGLDPTDPAAQEVRICLKCRLGSVRRRSQCPFGSCNSVKRKINPRKFPAKWYELTSEQRKFIGAEFQITDDSNRCCGSCHKRLSRRLETMPGFVGDSSSTDSSLVKQETWKDDDVVRFKEAISTLGTNNWDTVAAQIPGKTSEECKQYYSNQEKSSSTESKRTKVVGQVPGIEEEEEEDDGGNSDEDDNIPSSSVDNSRVPSPKIPSASKPDGRNNIELEPSPMVVETSLIIDEDTTDRKRKLTADSQAADDESSATLSADEGQNEMMMDADAEMKMDKKYMKVERDQTPKDSLSQRVAAVAPENLPACQPYKPKSRQIHRVEEENRIAAAIAAATTGSQFSRPGVSLPASSSKPSLLQHIQPLSAVIGLSTVSKNQTPTTVPQQTYFPYSQQAAVEPFCRPTVEQNPAECRDTESPMVVKVITKNKLSVDSLTQSPLPKSMERGSGQQQESVRGSLTKGTPVLPPTYIIGGDPSGQQKSLDMSKMFRPPPSKSEDSNRAASADTLEKTRFTPTDSSRFIPSGNGREQQQQQAQLMSNPAALFPSQQHSGMRLTYDQQLALLRQQQMIQMTQQMSAKQVYDQQAAALFSQVLGSGVSPNAASAQAQLLNDYRTAMQMVQQKPAGNGSTSGQQQQAANEQQLLAAQHLEMMENRKRAAFEQEQRQFVADQTRRIEQQCMAEHQKRILLSLSEGQRMAEIEKIRLFEQHYREQMQHQSPHQQQMALQQLMQQHEQRQQGDALRQQQQQQQQQGDTLRTPDRQQQGEGLRITEQVLRQQQQQQMERFAEAVRTERTMREREMINECRRTPSEQKVLDSQQRSIRSPSTGSSSGRQSAAVAASASTVQQQQHSQQMLEVLLHQQLMQADAQQRSIRSDSTGSSSGRQSAVVTSAATAQQPQSRSSYNEHNKQVIEALLHQQLMEADARQRAERSPSANSLSGRQSAVVTSASNPQQNQHNQQMFEALMQQQQLLKAQAVMQQQVAAFQQQQQAAQVTAGHPQQQQMQQLQTGQQQQRQQQLIDQQQQLQQYQTPLQQQQALLHMQQSLHQFQQSQSQQLQQSPHQQQQPSSSRSVQRSSPAVQHQVKSETKSISKAAATDSKPAAGFLRIYETIQPPPVTRQSIIQHGPPKPVTAKNEQQTSQPSDSFNVTPRSSVATGSQTVKRPDAQPMQTKAAMKEFPPFVKETVPGRRLIYTADDPQNFFSSHSSVSTPPMSSNVVLPTTTVIQQSSAPGSFVTPAVLQSTAVPQPLTSSHPLAAAVPLSSVTTGPPFMHVLNLPPTSVGGVPPLVHPGVPHAVPYVPRSPAVAPSSAQQQSPSTPLGVSSVATTYAVPSPVTQLPLYPSVSSVQQPMMYAPVSSAAQPVAVSYPSAVPQFVTAEILAKTSITGKKLSSVNSPKELNLLTPIATSKSTVVPLPVESLVKPLTVSSAIPETAGMPVVTLINSMITKHISTPENATESKKAADKSLETAPLKRPQQLPLRETVQKLERISSSLSEASPKSVDPFYERLSTANVPSPKANVATPNRNVIGLAALGTSTSNIIKHIDDVIIGEIAQTAKNREALELPALRPPPPPQPIAGPELEPVTPDSAPSTSIGSFDFGMDEKQQQNAAKHFATKQMSSSFEYDLEPVSPPEQPQYEAPLESPVVSKRPLTKPVAPSSATWNVSNRDISPDLALSQTTTPSFVPPHFNAFSIFTMPTASASTPTNVPVPPPMWSQTMAEDNESTRAVAALIETELQNDNNSSNLYKNEEPTVSSSNTIVNLPTYEPLSDDES